MMSALWSVLAFGLAAGGLLTVLSAGIAETPAAAAGNGQYSVFPTTSAGSQPRIYFNYLANAGSVINDSVTVTNQTSQAVGFRLFAADAGNATGGGFSIEPADVPKHTVGAWATLSNTLFVLPPQSLSNIPFTLQIPPGIAPGDYAGGIVMKTVNPSIQKRGDFTFSVYQNVGTRIYLRVRGPLHPGLTISQLSIGTYGFVGYLGGPVGSTVTYTLTNTGNQVLNPTVKLSVSPLIGSGTTVPPRVYSSLLPHNSVTVTYRIGSTWPFLRLQANLTATSGAGSTSASTPGWVIPWILMAVVIAILVLIWHRRRRRRTAAGGLDGATRGPATSNGASIVSTESVDAAKGE